MKDPSEIPTLAKIEINDVAKANDCGYSFSATLINTSWIVVQYIITTTQRAARTSIPVILFPNAIPRTRLKIVMRIKTIGSF